MSFGATPERCDPAKPVFVSQIQRTVADRFEITPEQICGRRGAKEIYVPRQLAMFIAYRHTRHTYNRVGQLFGGRDHSTIINGVLRTEQRLQNDSEIAEKYKEIIDSLGLGKTLDYPLADGISTEA